MHCDVPRIVLLCPEHAHQQFRDEMRPAAGHAHAHHHWAGDYVQRPLPMALGPLSFLTQIQAKVVAVKHRRAPPPRLWRMGQLLEDL